jgi:hypothetical protein
MVVHSYNPSYSGDGGRSISISRAAQAKLAKPYLKNKIQRKGCIVQEVECLPSMPEALSSVPIVEDKLFTSFNSYFNSCFEHTI